MDAKKLGKKIKLARAELDLTQTQLARKIGAKQKSISRYEAGCCSTQKRKSQWKKSERWEAAAPIPK